MTLVRKDQLPRGPEPGRSDLPLPHIVRPFAEPVQSMADGKFYDDPASLRRTYRADGNPQGVEYVEVGNEDITKFTPPKRDRRADREAIERAISDVENGKAPPILTDTPV
jgi:hypothetical protein